MTLTQHDLTQNAKDAVYIAIGAGVIGVQRANGLRTDLRQQLQGRLQTAKGRLDGFDLQRQSEQIRTRVRSLQPDLTGGVKSLEELVSQVQDRVDPVLDTVTAQLPGPAQQVVGRVREQATETRTQVFDNVERLTGLVA